MTQRPSPDAPHPDESAPRLQAVLRLSACFRPALRAHFAGLADDDLYLRFGTHLRPEVVDAYVAGIDFSGAIVLGVFDDDLELAGAAHLSPQDREWELGLSVLAAYRNRGVGSLLLQQAMRAVRAAGADRISVHCLAENHALLHVIGKVGATVATRQGESDGSILLPPEDAFGRWAELALDQMGAFDFGMRAQRLMSRLLVRRLLGAQGG
jgi:GNAT superfamily N-acetyltransferase